MAIDGWNPYLSKSANQNVGGAFEGGAYNAANATALYGGMPTQQAMSSRLNANAAPSGGSSLGFNPGQEIGRAHV